jgi:LemA protein
MTMFYIFLGVLLLLVIYIIVIYNKLVRHRNLMQEAWSGIDVFLKKRHDLVPNLVQVVKGYAAHEKQTLEDVIRYRSGAMGANHQGERIEMERGLGSALGRLLVVSESYPDLKANQNFLTLQHQLSEMEEELALSRRYYNGTVRELNILIESFPPNIFAGMFHFEKGLFFEIKKGENVVPDVSFS